MLYFSHDTKASVDEKIMQLRLEFGGAAVDAYWYLVERIYEKETKLVFFDNQRETRLVSYQLNANEEDVIEWVNFMLDLGLLTNDGGLWSDRISIGIETVNAKRETARVNGKKGGRPKKENQEKPSLVSSGFENKTQQKANKNKDKDIGLSSNELKPNIYAQECAAIDNAAPSARVPICPECESDLETMERNRDRAKSRFWCPVCHQDYLGGAVTWTQ